jgi:hypothetical protein
MPDLLIQAGSGDVEQLPCTIRGIPCNLMEVMPLYNEYWRVTVQIGTTEG